MSTVISITFGASKHICSRSSDNDFKLFVHYTALLSAKNFLCIKPLNNAYCAKCDVKH